MEKLTTYFEDLKIILKNVRNPEGLDEHPWTQSLIVFDALDKQPHLAQMRPGHQLIGTIASLFPHMQPAHPPRGGKRLDPRWGEFGLLAALYFAPFNQGTTFPTSLLDAWEKIDQAILYFIYGKPFEELTAEQVKKYQLVGPEIGFGSTSTLSDWHKKGVQRFAELILNREHYLSRIADRPSPILDLKIESEFNEQATSTGPRAMRRSLWWFFSLLLVIALSLCALKGWKIYEKGRVLYQDATQLRGMVQASMATMDFGTIAPELTNIQSSMAAFAHEARPLLWLSSKLGWVPGYGGDLISMPVFVEMTEHLLNASVVALDVAQPLLNEINSKKSGVNPAGLTALLVQAQPQLLAARDEFEQALVVRENIQTEKLSPRFRELLVNEIDPLLSLAEDGLSLAIATPGILGATQEGPKTYLILVQNEDELRPTGGFITSVGNLVIRNGQVISLEFEGVDNQEDWSKPYPAAPWQLQEYMNSPVLILRDANWFTNFPTSVLWAEYLYAYNHAHSVDGVIVFDQQFLVMLLKAIGPLDVDEAPYLLTDKNVIEYMRSAKIPPSGEPVPVGWDRKEFVSQIAGAVLSDIFRGQAQDWHQLVGVLMQALEERHLLLQLDDPILTALLVDHDLDNALRSAEGDFLMTADTNIGFNKTNALVNVSLSYDVDLTDVSTPHATLIVTHENDASRDVPCIHWNTEMIGGEIWYPTNRCYWNYLRVYKQAGTQLVDASPHAIPGEWMLLGQAVPARVDELEEEIDGINGFGTLLVVPGGQRLSTSFSFALSPTVIIHTDGLGEYTYNLKVKKQPGTLATPLLIRVHLPNRSALESITMDAVIQENSLLIETDLQTDIEFQLIFSLP